MSKKKIMMVAGIALLLGSFITVANANHSWGGYHWGRTANPLTLSLGDNLSSAWGSYLVTTSDDWSISTVIDTSIVSGTALRHKSAKLDCGPVSGTVQVCNKAYGNNGWLGIASIWASGEHIIKGTVKLNDTYFGTTKYNTSAWKNLVMCQEVGHTIGLDHQDEAFDNANLNTCMDYTNDPSTNQHPNDHDYAQIEAIYEHLDSVNTAIPPTVSEGDGGNGKGGGKGKPANVGQDIDLNDPSAWGNAVKQDARGNNSLYERNLGNGEKIFTFVVWAE